MLIEPPIGFTIVCAIVLVAALSHWIRTADRGFALIAAAFGMGVLHRLFVMFLDFASTFFRMQSNEPIDWRSSDGGTATFYIGWSLVLSICFVGLMIAGLSTLSFAVSSEQRKTSGNRGVKQHQRIPWSEVRRFGFAFTGDCLLVLGVVVMWRGASDLIRGTPGVGILGIGPTSIAIGLMCLWLAYHSKSPLNLQRTENS